MGLDTGGKRVPDLAGKWAKMEKVNQTRDVIRCDIIFFFVNGLIDLIEKTCLPHF